MYREQPTWCDAHLLLLHLRLLAHGGGHEGELRRGLPIARVDNPSPCELHGLSALSKLRCGGEGGQYASVAGGRVHGHRALPR